MKRLLIVVLSVFCTDVLAHVELVYPEGGESFVANSTVEIEWFPSVPHNTQNWDLLISYDAGTSWETLQADIHVDSLTFSWQVTSSASSETRIKVIQDNVGQDYDDQSNNFSVITNMIWSGATNTDWDNAGNWEAGKVPDSAHLLIIPNSATNFPVIPASGEVFGKELNVMLGAEFEVLSGGQMEISPM